MSGNFSEDRIMWNSDECRAGSSSDFIYHRIKDYLDEHEPSRMNLLGLATHLVADDEARMHFVNLVSFLFGGKKTVKSFIDRAISVAVMLERDNGLLD